MRLFLLLTLLLAACEAPPQPDDANDAGALGAIDDACSDDSDCASGLCSEFGSRCVVNECDDLGAPCDEAELFCTGGSGGRACEPARSRGERCAFSTDCCTDDFHAACADGLECGRTGVGDKASSGSCVSPTDRAAGEPCGDDVTSCAEGLVCTESAQTCE